jgi:hypothetical protein
MSKNQKACRFMWPLGKQINLNDWRRNMRIRMMLIALVGMMFASNAMANEVLVTDDIAVSTTWTADNVYNLQDQVYVLPGASLTIEAGTLVQSTAGLGGSLAVCRGAKIYVNGTAEAPVIMTSTNDDLATWRAAANEWGNLTVMGNALISASHYGGEQVLDNTKLPTGLNIKQMEGLTAVVGSEGNVMYGGDDDDDDSGSISYLSLRYGGKVIGLANELNGLSMGGIGRETNVDHVEIMNNVDDGIEIWGGTVNLKYVSIWNVGDDSFDVDQGWRGKAQYGLIVQGYSVAAKQGSGVGDNCFEIDGAEDSDAQPVTTANIYNFTVIGQPISGDHGTAWRDNARVQYHNCIWMDLGEQLVKFDGDDGDGASGYGYNGTLSWEDTWTTDYSVTSTVNVGDADPSTLYQAQTSGKLASITDSIFYNNLHSKAYTEAEARGVFDPMNNNVVEPEVSPIREIIRSSPEFISASGSNYTIVPVSFLDPRAYSWDSIFAVDTAPEDDGFFTPAMFRGGFGPYENWISGWTAASNYGMTN